MTYASVDCHRVTEDALAEQYVAGRLTGDLREAFELHYMACAQCFERVSTLHVARAHLEPLPPATLRHGGATAWRRFASWGVAASLVASLVMAGWLFSRPTASPEAPVPASSPVPPLTTRSADAVDIATLARLEPPPYQPSTLRGPEDVAVRQFRTAMQHYQRGDFGQAIPDLRRAAVERVDAAFFLAACQLLDGDATSAADSARRAVAFGDTPYLEDARLLLAKSLLRLRDRVGALRELDAVVAMKGEHHDEATALARLVESVP